MPFDMGDNANMKPEAKSKVAPIIRVTLPMRFDVLLKIMQALDSNIIISREHTADEAGIHNYVAADGNELCIIDDEDGWFDAKG